MAQEHLGFELRPWQMYAAQRITELKKDGSLRWPFVVLTVGRQQGKSWLIAALATWRMLSDRFGEPGQVTTIAQKQAVARLAWMLAARNLDQRDDVHVRYGVGFETMETEAGGNWRILASRLGAVTGYTSSLLVVDEAWKVDREVVEQGLMPQMIQRSNPQLLVVSTAGDGSSDLLTAFRERAINGSSNTLLLEWSAPPGVDIDDENAWYYSLPDLSKRTLPTYRALRQNTPEQQWRTQYLNLWTTNANGWVTERQWARCHQPDVDPVGPGVVMVDASQIADAWLAVEATPTADGAVRIRHQRSPTPGPIWQWIRTLPHGTRVLIGVTHRGLEPDDVHVHDVAGVAEVKRGIPHVHQMIERGQIRHTGDEQLTEHVLRAVTAVLPSGETVFRNKVGGPFDLCRAMVIAADQLQRRRQRMPTVYAAQ